MLEELVNKDTNVSVEEYWQLGGRLNRKSFKKARKIQVEMVEKGSPKVRKYSIRQAEEMEKYSGIEIAPEQKYLYAALREITREPEERLCSPQEAKGIVPVWALTDQPLMAEVLMLTGDMKNLLLFKSAYPHIFQNNKDIKN